MRGSEIKIISLNSLNILFNIFYTLKCILRYLDVSTILLLSKMLYIYPLLNNRLCIY